MEAIKGSCVALVTPMLEDGAIDWNSLEQLVEWHITQGTAALVIAGTTGEAPTLTLDEQAALFQFVVDKTKQRVPVIAGTGTNCTHGTIERTRLAQNCGVDAVLVVTPYYNKPPQEGILQHFTQLSLAVNLPIILYNHPGRTGALIEPATLAKLSNIENIIAVKDATANIAQLPELIQACHKDFIFLSGDDNTAYRFVLAGGHGVISVTSNVLPHEMAQCMRLALQGDAKSEAIDTRLQPMHDAMCLMVNPIPVKCMLNIMGKIQPGIRLPLVWPNRDIVATLRAQAQAFALAA